MLVEEELRELLTKNGFDGANAPIINGSGLKALEDPDCHEWGKKVIELVDAMDTYFPIPVRDLDKPFLMPIEDIFSIEGRGTVVTGRVERGVVKVGEEVEIVGIKDTAKTTVTGVEMFNKQLDQGSGWRQRRYSSPRYKEGRCTPWSGTCKEGFSYSSH